MLDFGKLLTELQQEYRRLDHAIQAIQTNCRKPKKVHNLE